MLTTSSRTARRRQAGRGRGFRSRRAARASADTAAASPVSAALLRRHRDGQGRAARPRLPPLLRARPASAAILRAAVATGDALARHVRAGDATHTPWPFRVNARTGAVLDGAQFGGLVVGPVRLLDELIEIRAGNTAAYTRARDLAWSWLLKHQLNPDSPAWNRWSGFYEDVPYNPRAHQPGVAHLDGAVSPQPRLAETVDPQWDEHATALLRWVRTSFGRGPFAGAWGIDEQRAPGKPGCCSRVGLGSTTSRWAAANATPLCAHRRRARPRTGRALAELRDVLRHAATDASPAADSVREHVLVQRRLRRLSAQLQLGNGGDARAGAQAAEPSPRLRARWSSRSRTRADSVAYRTLRRCAARRCFGCGSGLAGVTAGAALREREDLTARGLRAPAARRRRLRDPDPPRPLAARSGSTASC